MRIIILGGNGFIGQQLAKLLCYSSEVVVVSRRLPSTTDRLKGVAYLNGDCASSDFLRTVILPLDYVVFLAYNSVPKTSFEDPLSDIQENLPIAINLLNVLREVKVQRLLCVSSGGTVYGPVSTPTLIAEDHPTNPISPYGITKLAIEKYCQMYFRLFGIPIVIVRPSNPYGPGQIPFRGQGFVATAVAKILRNETLTVFGKYGTIRDYIYIDDLCSAIKMLLMSEIVPGSLFNIGSEIGMSNIQMIQSIAAVAGVRQADIRIESLPPRDFDVHYNVLNSSRLKALGWRPTTSLDQGLMKTITWVDHHLQTI